MYFFFMNFRVCWNFATNENASFSIFNEEEKAFFEKLKNETFEEWKEIFDIFDDNNTNSIESEEIIKVMQGLKMNTDQASVDKIMLEIDYDKNGVVDFDEFIVLMVKTMVSVDRTEEELVSVFKRFDKDNDDQINKTDLLLTFEELGYENVKLEDT